MKPDSTGSLPTHDQTSDWDSTPMKQGDRPEGRGPAFADLEATSDSQSVEPGTLDENSQNNGDRACGDTAPFVARKFGNYELIAEIARGGMGVVFKARQLSLDRTVALKMILDGRVASESAVKRFYKEAHAAAALDHPNIVPIYEIGQEEGHHFFSMAFVEGASLKAHIARKGPLPPAEAIRMLLPIVEAVECAHQHNIIHRDLKPDNVLIDSQGRPRVTDFGLAKQLDEGDAGMTGAGQILGTPAYMAPEQALGGQRKVGAAADIYALGGMLYFLLTGKAPFSGATVTEVLCKVVTEPAQGPRLLNPLISEGIDDVCRVCLEKDVEKRYPSATALRNALLRLQENPSSGASVSPPAATSPSANRSVGILVGATAVVLLLAGGLWMWSPWTKNQTEVAPGPFAATPVISAEQEKKILENWKNDFGLNVEMLGNRPGPQGIRQFLEGDALRFQIETDRDAYVGIWTIDSDGVVEQVFPNKFEKDNLVRAHSSRTVPGAKAEMFASATKGIEEVQVLASSRPWNSPEIKAEGSFLSFKTPQERKTWDIVRRGIIVKAAPSGQAPTLAAREVISYQVNKRPGK